MGGSCGTAPGAAAGEGGTPARLGERRHAGVLRSCSEVALARYHPLTRGARLAFRYVRGSSTEHIVDVVEVVGQVGDSHGCFPILRHGLPRDAGVGQSASGAQAQWFVADVAIDARLIVRVLPWRHTARGAQRQHVLDADVELAVRSILLLRVE